MLRIITIGILLTAVIAQAPQPYPITGCSTSGQSVPLRRNIDALQSEAGPQWDLYIQAMLNMFAADSDDPLSYFQIAGIHGRPFIAWNNTGPEARHTSSSDWKGYCPHGEPLFLSWHRPYVLLFEEALVAQAKQLAQLYPINQRNQYIQAAEDLRAPFWDWASSESVPQATVPMSVTVNAPNGRQSVTNPLKAYIYPQRAVRGRYGQFDQISQTGRCPSPDSYPDSANSALQSRGLKSSLYDAFSINTEFSQFGSILGNGHSVEQLHNEVHADAACGQQFSNPEYAAFDPLFMMHHCNMDRLWAYWQVLNPSEASMSESYSGYSRWSTLQGTNININSPLQPFFSDKAQLHTSESVSATRNFGYTYEELEFWNKTADEMKRDATQLINRLYSDSASTSAQHGASMSSNKSIRSSRDLLPTKLYFLRAHLKAEELPGPASIKFIIGGKNVGSMMVMAQPNKGDLNLVLSLDKLVDGIYQAGQGLINGLISGKLDSLKVLQVNITKFDNSPIALGSVPSFTLELENVERVPRISDDELPKHINKHVYQIFSVAHLGNASSS